MASLLLVFLFFSISLAAVEADQGGGGSTAPRPLWCVAKNNAEDIALQSALDWACGPGGANCEPIQKGGPCYEAADLARTASYVFNDYYLKNRHAEDSCSFSNTAAVTSLNPSHGNCKFRSSTGTSNGNFSGPGSNSMADTSDLKSSSSSITIARFRWCGRASILVLFLVIVPLVV